MKPRHAVLVGVVGLMGVGMGALMAWAHRDPSVPEAPPPHSPPPRIMTMRDVWMGFARTMKPYQPPPPMKLTIPREQARDEILAEIRRLCLVLKQNRLTAMQLARQLGSEVEFDEAWPDTVEFRARSPYFTRGSVSRGSDGEGELTDMADSVWLELTDPRLVLAPELEKALGPHSGLNVNNLVDSWDPNGLDLVWPGQPRGKGECHIGAHPQWGERYYGLKENPVRDIIVNVWPDE